MAQSISSRAPKTPTLEKHKALHQKRFILNPAVPGGHEHHLNPSHRRGILSRIWRNLLSLMEDHNRWAISFEKYGRCHEVIGHGALGTVRVSHKKENRAVEKLYAVKQFHRWREESDDVYGKRVTAEFSISNALRHHNVVRTIDLLYDAGYSFEIMEFCDGGNLYALIRSAGMLEVEEANCLFKQLMRGVEYIHEMGIAHRDLKPENVLLTSCGVVKIGDFGNGHCFRMAWETQEHMVSGLCGSTPYIAPEGYSDEEFDACAADVWACGIIYMVMRTGSFPWTIATTEDECYSQYLEDRRKEEGYDAIESFHQARCRNVVYCILDPKPRRRITTSQILNSEWSRAIKLCKAGESLEPGHC